ncbi:hypothetical protein ACWDE9_19830, partial [Streptomyces olivaceoviridis]
PVFPRSPRPTRPPAPPDPHPHATPPPLPGAPPPRAPRPPGADVTAVSDKAEIPAAVAGMAKPGDLVLTMGAGDVTDLGPLILERLSQ